MKKLFIIFLSFLSFLLVGCTETKIPTTTSTETETATTTTETDTTISLDTVVKSGVSESPSKVYFMEINDTHGQLTDSDSADYMSLSMVEAITEREEYLNGEAYIKICVGDLFQGSYIGRMTYGECFIDALNAMDYDCMVLGNHEFDWGLDKISVYWDGDASNGEANFPLLCANLLDSRTSECPSWIEPYTIIQYGDVKVGIIGAIGSGLESSIDQEMLGTYYFTSVVTCVNKYAKILRSSGCDVVVAALHDYNSDTNDKIANFNNDAKVDAIFCAHTHQYIETYYSRPDGYKLPIIESQTKNMSIGEIILDLDDNNQAKKASIAHYYKSSFTSQKLVEDEDVLKIVEKYQDLIDLAKEVVCTISSNYSKQDCADLMVRAMMWKYESDLGFVNSGGVRTILYAGDVTIEDIFAVFPFDNTIVISKMYGSKLLSYIDSRSDLYTNYSFSRNNIEDNSVYDVATISYIYNASNKYYNNYVMDDSVVIEPDIMRDVLIEYLRNNQ